MLPRTVGSALQNLPAMNVRSYGPALAQTVSMYGFSGSQLSVLWGDVPLNHAMLGLADLSLYPSLMIDKVDVNAQQGSAEYGAHAIGGIITLEHERAPQARQSLQYQRSNLDASTYQARIQQPIGRWYIDAGAVYQDAPNAFSYLDITQNPAEHKRRTNADKSLASAVGIIAYTSRSYTSEKPDLADRSPLRNSGLNRLPDTGGAPERPHGSIHNPAYLAIGQACHHDDFSFLRSPSARLSGSPCGNREPKSERVYRLAE